MPNMMSSGSNLSLNYYHKYSVHTYSLAVGTSGVRPVYILDLISNTLTYPLKGDTHTLWGHSVLIS